MLCTVECPGSGMAWWVNTCAKPHPPHIVLLVDFPHSLVPICGTSALPLPSWLGRPTARFLPQSPSAWGETVPYEPMSGLGQGQFLKDASIARLPAPPVSDLCPLFCWYKVGGKYHSLVQISVHVRSLGYCASVLHYCGISLVCLHPALKPNISEHYTRKH